MTPADKLKEIESHVVVAWPTQGYKNTDVIWLINRVKHLESFVKSSCEVAPVPAPDWEKLANDMYESLNFTAIVLCATHCTEFESPKHTSRCNEARSCLLDFKRATGEMK